MRITEGETLMSTKGTRKGPPVEIGERCGTRVIIDRVGYARNGRSIRWRAMCDCGSIMEVSTANFRHGHSCLQCGYLKTGASKRIHGHTNRKAKGEPRITTRLYGIWQKMRNRCNNPRSAQYKWYGGKGVALCAAWNDFRVFRDWAEASGYQDHLTIERRNSSLGYSPENCEWITHSENSYRARIPSMPAGIWNGALSFGI